MTGILSGFSPESTRAANSSYKGFLLDRVWVRSANGPVTEAVVEKAVGREALTDGREQVICSNFGLFCLLRYQLEENDGIGREGSDLGFSSSSGGSPDQIDQRQAWMHASCSSCLILASQNRSNSELPVITAAFFISG